MSIVKMLLLAGALVIALDCVFNAKRTVDEIDMETAGAPEDDAMSEEEEDDLCDQPDEADEDDETEPVPAKTARASVKSAFRAMNPLTLQGETNTVFVLEDGREVNFGVQGESGLHLTPGDEGTLEYCGVNFISFEKDNGEFCGQLFYAPAPETEG